MSTVIDHAISIPAPQEQVWQQVRDIQLNTEWQANSEQVTFLTGKQNGRGTRWRNLTPDGSEQVIEITAWYEGLGYEYVIVDGVSFETNRGRIRLQEVPEGTVVQWTFTYEVGGMFGSLRNALGTKGRIDGDVVDSLRNLYRYVKSTRNDEYTPEQSRALMRAAPDVEERSKYQPRHPSVVRQGATDSPAELNNDPDAMFKPPAESQPAESTPEPAADAQPVATDAAQSQQAQIEDTAPDEVVSDEAVPIVEPPLSEDDTRPNPTVQETDSLDEADVPEEATTPETLTAFDTQKRPATEPVSDTEAAEAPPEDTTEETEETIEDNSAAEDAPAVAAADDTISSRDDTAEAIDTTASSDDSTTTAEPEPVQSEPDIKEVAPPQPPQPRPDFNKLDTSQVSVFDLFGVPRPGEIDSPASSGSDAPAVPNSPPSEPAIASDPAAEQERISESAPSAEASPFDDAPIMPDIESKPQPGRTGLRARLRRRLTRLRRP